MAGIPAPKRFPPSIYIPSVITIHPISSKRPAVLTLVALVFFLLSTIAKAVVVQPSELHFESRLDDTPMLQLEIDLGGATAKALTADLDGFRGDRRVLSNGDGKFTVQIAPDTDTAGAISGKILLKVDGKPVASAIPFSGIVRPWVKVQPSRLFLGSIGHGVEFTKPQTYSITLSSDTEAFNIESVTFQGITGATWACDPQEEGSVKIKHITFTFSPDALAAGVPYGALANKAVVMRLSHSEAASIILPVQGLISVNTTGRDYSLYLYGGHVRWQGPWATPNVAAAFLATALVLLSGLASVFHRHLARWGWWQVSWMTVIFIAMGIGCWLLAATYSRGGWAAAFLGIAILWLASRPPRLYISVFLGLFLVSIALHPAGLSRVASTTLVSDDRSIHHRLLVWIGALQMMAEHPWTGIGAGQFGKVFEKDYQLPTHTADYTTAINDFLTLGAERGLPILFLATTFALGLVVTALRVGTRHGHAALFTCGAAIACYMVCCWFSSIGFKWNPTALPLAAAVGVVGQLSWIAVKSPKGSLLRGMSRHSLRWLAISAVIVAILAAAEIGALFLRPVVSKIVWEGVSGIEVRPRWRSSKGAILYIGDPKDDADLLMKSTLRPLAKRGWTVFALDQPISGSDAFEELRSQVEKMRRNGALPDRWQLAGHRRGAQLALALAPLLQPESSACYLTPYRSAFPDLSPVLTLPRFRGPVLLVAQDADPVRTQQHLLALQGVRKNSGLIAADTHANSFSLESASWQLWIQRLDDFCTPHDSTNNSHQGTAHK